jgi:hypothetical protein
MEKIIYYLRYQLICDVINFSFVLAVLLTFVSLLACIIAVISEAIKLISHG